MRKHLILDRQSLILTEPLPSYKVLANFMPGFDTGPDSGLPLSFSWLSIRFHRVFQIQHKGAGQKPGSGLDQKFATVTTPLISRTCLGSGEQ